MRAYLITLAIPFATACAMDGIQPPGDLGSQDSAADAPGRTAPSKPKLNQCVGRTFDSHDVPSSWQHFRSRITSLGDADHAADDLVVVEGAPVRAHARFLYAPLLVSLSDEKVRIFLDDCRDFQYVAEVRTDGNGAVDYTFPALPIGVYDVRYEVEGDLSVAAAQLWVLPRGSHLAVYDIDGTLTTSDAQMIFQIASELVSGDYQPSLQGAAVDLTWAHRGEGEVGVYLTGRFSWLTQMTKRWIDDTGFAPGAVHTAGSFAQGLPTQGGVGAYKLAYLRSLENQGFVLDFAYGNATTDIFAYENAGLAGGAIWIMGSHGGEQGTNAESGTWQPRVDEIDALPKVDQPFRWE